MRIFYAAIVLLVLAGCSAMKDMGIIGEPCPHYRRVQVVTLASTNGLVKKAYGTIPVLDESAKRNSHQLALLTCDGGESAAVLKAMLYRAADLGADGLFVPSDFNSTSQYQAWAVTEIRTVHQEPCVNYNRIQVANFSGGTSLNAKPYGAVELIADESKLAKQHTPIAFMTCEGTMAEEGSILNAMLYHAAELGADGLIVVDKGVSKERITTQQESQQNVNVTVRKDDAALVGGTQNEYTFRAYAVRYK